MGVLSNFSSAPTYTRIAYQYISSTASSITFTNIPQGYTDLVMVVNPANSSDSGQAIRIRLNGVTGSSYSVTYLQGLGGSANSAREADNQMALGYQIGIYTGLKSTYVLNFMNYSNTSMFKSVIMRSNNSADGTSGNFGLFRTSDAITTINIAIGSYGGSQPSFAAGSNFALYGIKSAIAPKATGGDSISQDGKYWYHTYRTSGIFNPNQSLSVDVLSIAGGGGTTANYGGGGGGAGGLIYSATNSVSSIQTVTVGAGGVGRTNGSNSQFGSLTAAVGGGFGGTQGYQSSTAVPGQNGGSGGGGGSGTSIYSGGTGTAGQGTNGGNGTNTSTSALWAGGGGGGASGGGGAASSQAGGAGGAGTNTYASWATVTQTGVNGYYAGGGGGGTFYGSPATGGAAGVGGGGAGRNGDLEVTKSNGVVNTGGGAGSSGPLSSGGSGLVIVRYAI